MASDRYLRPPRGMNGPDQGRDARILRDRQAVSDRDADRIGPGVPVATARQLVQVYDGGAIPNAGDHYFACHPAEIDGTETEGGPATFAVDATRTLMVDVLREAVVAGDMLIAHAIGGRWVAEKGKAPPKPKCEFFCGPTVNIAAPFVGTRGLATIDVNGNGTLGNLKLVQAGTGYTTNPTVTIPPPPGGGIRATATATVGAVLTIGLGAGGNGYTVAPVVTISDPGGTGTGATATAAIDAHGHVVSLTLVNGGSLYLNPIVSITGDGAGATATATAGSHKITSLTLTNPGTGYTVSNIPPAAFQLTITSPTITIGPFRLNYSGTTLPLPNGQMPCSWGATTKADFTPVLDCPEVSDVTISASVVYYQGFWQLLTQWNIDYGTKGFLCGAQGAVCPKLGNTPIILEQLGITACTERPFTKTWSFDLIFNELASYFAYVLFGGGGGACGPLHLTFTLTEVVP